MIFFSSPEQRVLRFLLSEPTTAFTPRVISSKLKGVRGLGGTEGISRILNKLQGIGLVDFVDNHRSVRLQDDNPTVGVLKSFSAICDLEGLKDMLTPLSSKGVLFGSRATGRARSDSDYNVFVVTETPDEAKKIASKHPLGKLIHLVTCTPEQYGDVEKNDPGLARHLTRGIVVWGTNW